MFKKQPNDLAKKSVTGKPGKDIFSDLKKPVKRQAPFPGIQKPAQKQKKIS